MRRKVRTNSTMKTITYGFFIYVSLTTIHGISAETTNPNNKTSNVRAVNKSNCDLPSIIKKSKYLEKCANITIKDTLPEWSFENVISYLCLGIFETVDIICELNLSINSTTFENGMSKSQPITQNLTKFCSAMQDTIKNKTYNSMINATAHPNVINLNRKLLAMCPNLCWKEMPPTLEVNSLCAVLFWENRILSISKTPPKSITNTSVSKTPELVNKTEVIEDDKSKITENKPATEIIDNVKQDEAIPESIDPKIDTEHVEQVSVKKDQLPKAESEGKLENTKGEKNLNRVTTSREKSETNDGPPPEIIESSKDKTENQEARPIPSENAKQEVNNKLVDDKEKLGNGDVTPGDNTNSKIEADDIGPQLTDSREDEEEKILDTVDAHQTDTKKSNSNPKEEIEASSNDGKEDNSDGQGKASINQESTAPKEHSSGHVGPQDDPPQHFFAYFMAVSFICLICYVGYHKKHKIMGIIFEGRKSRGGRGRRRPNTAGYRKLDCNLEEAVTSQCNSNVTHVIY